MHTQETVGRHFFPAGANPQGSALRSDIYKVYITYVQYMLLDKTLSFIHSHAKVRTAMVRHHESRGISKISTNFSNRFMVQRGKFGCHGNMHKHQVKTAITFIKTCTYNYLFNLNNNKYCPCLHN